MADVRPLPALHYRREVADPADVTAPPYDVIGPRQRAALVQRSSLNVVEVDLPTGDDPYSSAAETLATWRTQGVLQADREPALWAQTHSTPTPTAHATCVAASTRGSASRTTAPGASGPTSARSPARRRTGCA
ncbi:MAG: DUF1015 family protein [Solirubrobacterales bacterium]